MTHQETVLILGVGLIILILISVLFNKDIILQIQSSLLNLVLNINGREEKQKSRNRREPKSSNQLMQCPNCRVHLRPENLAEHLRERCPKLRRNGR